MATEPLTVTIEHHFTDGAEHSITVTMIDAGTKARLERKVLKAKGDGDLEVTFAVPAEQSGKSVNFAAFVGENFAKAPQHIQSTPQPVK